MSKARARTTYLLLAAFTLQSIEPPAAIADPVVGRAWRAVTEVFYHGTEPESPVSCSIEELAENIDWVEQYIDRYGSIVAKQPDIWGEARLTKHRDEYEKILYGELNQFAFKLNATISQSDQSFLAQAIALSAAASARPRTTTNTSTTVQQSAPAESAGPTATPLTYDQMYQLSGGEHKFSELKSQLDLSHFAGGGKIDVEPTIFLNQLSRYLQHLQELRRINEGDDTSDSPGYALNLVRMPVSMLPGKLTREGFGAEITVTATPVLSDDLLPTTFENLVVNDLVDQLGLPVVRIAEQYDRIMADAKNSPELKNRLEKLLEEYCSIAGVGQSLEDKLEEVKKGRSIDEVLENSADSAIVPIPNLNHLRATRDFNYPAETLRSEQLFHTLQELQPTDSQSEQPQLTDAQKVKLLELGIVQSKELTSQILGDAGDLAQAIAELSESIAQTSGQVQLPGGRARNARQPVPPTQISAVFGRECLKKIAFDFRDSYSGRYVRWAGQPECKVGNKEFECRVDLLDAQKWLQAEIAAAYELLSQPEHLLLWYAFARPGSGLVEAIRGEHENVVACYRCRFFEALHCHDPGRVAQLVCQPITSECCVVQPVDNPVDALAWAVVVESALLNERLNEDVRKVAITKGCYELPLDQRLTFFLPSAVNRPYDPIAYSSIGPELWGELQCVFQQATKVFQDYVRCRWPIHVFAVDPVEQDQNVADFSARKRELQFALAMGFVSGQTSAQSLTRFARQFETEIETISLNQTVVGFSHGDDTFGWRFHPRVQALDIPGTFGAACETIRGTPRDYDLKQRHLEPGIRECVAIVLMPSFIPYLDFDVRSNWFKLTNPKNTALSMRDTMRLSRAIRAMENSRAQCAECQEFYRDGEVNRLMRRVAQLDREVPLQTMRVQVPYENTLGGFEMFNTGVTDLAPELIGWYGAPGVVIRGEGNSDGYQCGCFKPCSLVTVVTEKPAASASPSSGTPTPTSSAAAPAPTAAPAAQSTTVVTQTSSSTKAQPLPICSGSGTTLFLVGDHFSVHDTKVIAGGVCIPDVQLVSRQIMRVTIPSCVNTVNVDGKDYVAVYAATPYGVTNHLHVPIYNRPVPKATSDAIAAATKQEVESQLTTRFKELRLAPRDVTVAPLGNDKKLLVNAICQNPNDPGDLTFQLRQGSTPPQIQYIVENEPAFAGKTGSFFVVAHRGKFLGTMQPIGSPRVLGTRGDFESVPGLPNAKAIMDQLKSGISLQDFKDGKATARLVYYLHTGCCPTATRLMDELEVEIALVCDPCQPTPPVTTVEPKCECLGTPTPTSAPATKPSPSPASAAPCPCGADAGSPELRLNGPSYRSSARPLRLPPTVIR